MKGLIVLLFTISMFQVNAQDIVGDWNGKISYQGTDLRIVFHVTGQNGKYKTTMDSPDQGASGIAIGKTTFENGKLTIEDSDLGLKYSAELGSKGESLKGTFNQQGISLPLVLAKKGTK